MREEEAWWTPKFIGKIINKIDNLELKMRKMTTSDDRGREPLYKPHVAPPRHRGGNRFRGMVRNPKPAIGYSNGTQGTNGLKEIMDGHKTVFTAIAHKVDIVVEADLREICLVLEEVDADLIKVPMLADQELLVGQFLEMPPDVIIARNQAIYRDSVEDVKTMKID